MVFSQGLPTQLTALQCDFERRGFHNMYTEFTGFLFSNSKKKERKTHTEDGSE